MANKENGMSIKKVKEECQAQSPNKNKFNIRLVPLNKLLDPKRIENGNTKKVNLEDTVVLVSSDEDGDGKNLKHNTSVQKTKKLKVRIKNLKLNSNKEENVNEQKTSQITENNLRSRLRRRNSVSASSLDQPKNHEQPKLGLLETSKPKRKLSVASALPTDKDKPAEKTLCHENFEDNISSQTKKNIDVTPDKDNELNGKKNGFTSNGPDNLPNSKEPDSKKLNNSADPDLSLVTKKKENTKGKVLRSARKNSSENSSDKITHDLNLESSNVRSKGRKRGRKRGHKNILNNSNSSIADKQDISSENLKTSSDFQEKDTVDEASNNNNQLEHNTSTKNSSRDETDETNQTSDETVLSNTHLDIESLNTSTTTQNNTTTTQNNTTIESNNSSKSLQSLTRKLKVKLKRTDLKKVQKELLENSKNQSLNLEKTTAVKKPKQNVEKKKAKISTNRIKIDSSENEDHINNKNHSEEKETIKKRDNKTNGEKFGLSSSSESKKEEDDTIASSDDDGNSLKNKQNIEGDDDSDSEPIKIPKKKMSRKFITLSDSSDEDDEQVNYVDGKEEEEEEDESSSNSEVFVKRAPTTRSTRTRKPTKDDDFDYNNLEDSNNSEQDKFEDSDSSAGKKKKKAPKRKRIKNASDTSDDDEPGSSNKKRKNIRKLLNKNELNVDTKRAAEIERERRKRIHERQRLYNSIYEKPENIELKELILDFDEETQEPLLKVDDGLLKKLKPHQAAGVKFMWDACFETIKQSREAEGSGCILAHCMGLGKTLQVITLTHALLTHTQLTGIERALVITPLSTLTNWAREYHDWLKFCKNKEIEVYDMSKFKDKNLRTFKLNEWYEEGGVCIIGYDMYRILSNEKAKGLRKKQRDSLQKALVDPGPDIVICDEGHLLKNEKTSLSQAVTKMRTKRRIVLTGTPLQNNLKEYYCMIQFIKPNLLGTYKEYLNRFVNPITNGQYTDSTERDIRLMKHRSHILHKLLEGCIQRRDYSVLAPYLPPKQEYSVFVTMSDIQQKIYEYYMTKQRDYFTDINGKGAKLFQDFQNLRRIWTHPMCLRVNSDLAIKKRVIQDTDEEGSLKDFVVQDSEDETSSSESDDSFDSDKTIDSDDKQKKKPRKTRNARQNSDSDIEEVIIQTTKEDPSEWWCQLVPKEELTNIFNSPKLVLLMKILSECEAIGDKLLLFSQSLQSLDVIEEFLSLIDRKKQGEQIEGNVGDFEGTWQPGIDYYRLDGSCSVENREAMCKEFNNVANLRARLFLISTRAGSLGINLVAANRVVIFDVSWNPSHDTQSIFRVYRFGQDRPCYIYRFIALGTMEQKVYERQVVKQSTAKRVIDEQQIGRHYNQNDLLELYTYELKPREAREVPILPKDRLFAELLANYEKLIFKYHEHDSLLENQESDNLSEEERKAAWDEYEIEKTRPPTQPYVYYNRQNYSFGNTPMNGPVTSNKIFGFRTDILLRLLNMKVGVDNPALNQTQILQLVPRYLQELYKQMNDGNPAMYKELLELHSQLEMPQGYYMNPLLYANQAPPDGGSGLAGNSITARGPPTTSTEIVEID